MKYISFTQNVSVPDPIMTDGTLATIGGIIVLENFVAMAILYRCEKLNFQLKILSMNRVHNKIKRDMMKRFYHGL